jgi:hypothetical protein
MSVKTSIARVSQANQLPFGRIQSRVVHCRYIRHERDGGAATSATMNAPFGVAFDNAGDLDIVDSDNYRIREVSVLASELNFATRVIPWWSRERVETCSAPPTLVLRFKAISRSNTSG